MWGNGAPGASGRGCFRTAAVFFGGVAFSGLTWQELAWESAGISFVRIWWDLGRAVVSRRVSRGGGVSGFHESFLDRNCCGYWARILLRASF